MTSSPLPPPFPADWPVLGVWMLIVAGPRLLRWLEWGIYFLEALGVMVWFAPAEIRDGWRGRRQRKRLGG
jgi:uncharacterized membrane protein YhhN